MELTPGGQDEAARAKLREGNADSGKKKSADYY